jgi:hypothetical protein
VKLFYRNLPFAFSSILFGLTNILIYFGFISLEKIHLVSFVLIYLGVYLVYQELSTSRRNLIVAGILSFFFGLLILVINHYRIFLIHKIIFSTMLFVLAIIFLFLFLNSSKNKVFLHLAISFMIISLVSVFLPEVIPFHYRIDLINKSILQNWYVVLGIIGVGFISIRKDV